MRDREHAAPFERRVRGVILGTAASGVAGGILGAGIGAVAPGFLRWLLPSGAEAASPVDMGTGLGAVAGLLLGAAGTLLLAMVESWRETRIGEARLGRDAEEGS